MKNAAADATNRTLRIPPRIAVFASGAGTNFQALVEAVRAGNLDAEITLLVCDRPDAPALERAHELEVQTAVFEPKRYDSREQYEQDVLSKLRAQQIEWVVLAGYMRLVTSVLLEAYGGRMVNIHPSLLPAFPGLHAVRQALEYGVKITGATVHLVDEGMDTGPIVAQQVIDIRPEDTLETLAERIQAVEHELYPRAIQSLMQSLTHC
ncbi:phosphoribosylglycinamide formyltransferase [Paenibacillus sp. 481]|nr:phosphoribosylglycinamide formyltransferase [Paenibacillus sp. 481]